MVTLLRLTALILLLSSSLSAATRYVAQSAGTFSGGVACNGQTAITPATFNSTILSAGDTTYICGTITASADTTALTISQSGSPGNLISLIFDSGGSLTAPYWGLTGAINIGSQSYILIDGGANGLITATAAGTGLTYACTSGHVCNTKGIYMLGGSHIEVKNVTMTSLYVHVCSGGPPFTSCTDDSGTQGSAGIYSVGAASTNQSNLNFHNNTISDVYAGIYVIYSGSATASAVSVNTNTVSNANWSIVVGSGATNAILNTLNVNNNTMSGWDNWNTDNNQYHHDGVFLFTQAAGDSINYPVVNANLINSPTTLMTGQIFIDSLNAGTDVIVGAIVSNNIIFNPSSNTTGCPADGYITIQANGAIVANNTIAASIPGGCSGASNNGNHGIDLLGTGTVYLNNIITNCNYGLLSASGSSISTSDYNDLYNCSYYGQQEPASANSTLASWQSAYPSLDAHSSSTSPSLTSTYQPTTATPGGVTGTNLTGTYCGTYPLLCYDYAGNARPSSGAWSIGAYQNAGANPTGISASGISASGSIH